jgi:hypothetical protein
MTVRVLLESSVVGWSCGGDDGAKFCWSHLYTVKKSFGFTGYCGFFRFWDQKTPSMGAEIFYPSYKVSFLIGEKENQFRLYERGFFRLQNIQAINRPCSVENRRISSFKGREKSSHQYPSPPPAHATIGCNVGNQLKQCDQRRAWAPVKIFIFSCFPTAKYYK